VPAWRWSPSIDAPVQSSLSSAEAYLAAVAAA
jgi:hypothetical protein